MPHIPIWLAKMGVGLEAQLVARECMGEGSGSRIGIVYLFTCNFNQCFCLCKQTGKVPR